MGVPVGWNQRQEAELWTYPRVPASGYCQRALCKMISVQSDQSNVKAALFIVLQTSQILLYGHK